MAGKLVQNKKMPRTRATRKADTNRSRTTADKVKEVTEVTPKEHLQAVIRDMQCQSKFVKKYTQSSF